MNASIALLAGAALLLTVGPVSSEPLQVVSIEPIAEVVGTYPSWSPDGKRIAFERDGDLFVMNLDGSNIVPVAHHDSLDETPVWTPAGELLFASAREGELDVFAVRADGTGLRRLTDDPADDDHPRASPDGSSIIFNSKRHDGATYQVWIMDADGGDQRRLTYHDQWDSYPSISRDGGTILWRRVVLEDERRNSEVFVMNLEGHEPINLTSSPAFDGYPVWSPNEQWVAFASDRDSERLDQLFIMRTDGSDMVRLNPLEDGVQYARPAWSPDGMRIIATRDSNHVTTFVIVTLEEPATE